VKATEEEMVIESVGVRGDGIARAGDAVVFVPRTLPGERVRVRLGKPGKDGTVRGALKRVVEPAPERAEPPCPHFGVCGGCALQHMEDGAYAAWKTGVVLGALERQGLPMDVVEPLVRTPPGARRRADLTVVRRKDDLLLGFNARAEHRVIDLAECPVLMPAIVALFPALRETLARLFRPGDTGEVRVNMLDRGPDIVLVTGAKVGAGGRARLAELAAERGAVRLSLRHPKAPTAETVAELAAPTVSFGHHAVAAPPGAFLQASREGEQALREFVMGASRGAARVADLFCGLGAFALPLAAYGAAVLAVDGDRAAVAALEAAARGMAKGRISVQARDLDKRPLTVGELNRFDVVVFDPPRLGARPLAAQLAASRVPKVVAVSCNPASFARDARILTESGYRLRRVLPVDQFLWSPHVELAALLERA